MKTTAIINNLNNNTVVIIDFDHTLTTFSSETSFGVFSLILNNSYKKKKKRIDFVTNLIKCSFVVRINWYRKIKLLKKYIKPDSIKIATSYFFIRPEMKELLNECKKRNIPVIICSSGLKEIITSVLNLNKIFSYTSIVANDFNTDFKEIITPYNKSDFIDVANYKNAKFILIGDQDSDKKMIKDVNKEFYKINYVNNEDQYYIEKNL